MAWVKLDDSFDEHPKVDGLSDAAFRLHVAALCYCNRSLTDGHIPAHRALRLTATATDSTLIELVGSGLWDDAPGGWVIHDYLSFQPSKAQVLADREAAAERARRYREKKASQRDAQRDVTGDEQRESRVPRPDPSRPEGSRDGGSETTPEPPVGGEQRRAQKPFIAAARIPLEKTA